MCDRVVSEHPFLIVYCLYKYITQEMCDDGVDNSLVTLNGIFYWFLTNKIIKKRFATLYVK